MSSFYFPDGFLWGTATTAAQIETASDHDWKGVRSKDGYILGETAAHERFFREDAELIAGCGNTYRFSLDWAKLQPAPNAPFNPVWVTRYRDFMLDLKKRNIHLMLTLHHTTNPRWFADLGGWTKRANLVYFDDFVDQVISNFGDLIDSWITFNEPNNYAAMSFLFGQWPPYRHNPGAYNRVRRHLAMSHEHAYVRLKKAYPAKPVGIALSTVVFSGTTILGKWAASLADQQFTRETMKLFVPLDFIGVNYYARLQFTPWPLCEMTAPGRLAKRGLPHDKMWEYYPQGLFDFLKRFHDKYHLPLYVTENGICTDDDSVRIDRTKDYIRECARALKAGVDLRGYIHWTLMDNFEWKLGPTYRFGLVSVNRETMERTPKPSYGLFSEIARSNEIELSELHG
ncbi:hypothetical protein AUK40_03605 [Candidatus Wirthbacteria bacterium CG2_30_54_11]|uniref:Beta-glucosidase n=1 Tax=Candidatus Wirthbacteria bacterium CG2_30_54_11 TaxID=1817892 RepID=A0A1J5IKL3_9BACT|nr:MAG: hypothetical protein AUK40_03605 [Candidatus Wirthbacteria bacterium CG2_30_54_11]